jgi:hypothetical protein
MIPSDKSEHEFAEAFAWLTALIGEVVPWRPVTVNLHELATALAAAWDMIDERPSFI